jgi:tetratricopeptide (TPR) repeat protein
VTRAQRLASGVAVLLTLADPLAAQRATADPEALARQGRAALEERRYAEALTAFAAAAKLLPRDADVAAGAGFSAYMLGRNDEAAPWLETALRLNPNLVPVSVWLGELRYRQGRLDEAIAAYEAALERAPGTAALEERLATWRREQRLVGRFARSRSTHFSVLFEGPSDEIVAQRVVDYLEAAYLRVGEQLTAYPTQPITVVLYTTEQFQDVTRAPSWGVAAYDGRIRLPIRGALQQVDVLDRVLTHEFVHALVATLGGRNVPMWLNEGLANTFEPGGPERAEIVLGATSERPPLRQLHDSFERLNPRQAQIAYAYGTHAVGRIMRVSGPSAVVALLRDLGQGEDFGAAFRRRTAMRYEEFEDIVRRE